MYKYILDIKWLLNKSYSNRKNEIIIIIQLWSGYNMWVKTYNIHILFSNSSINVIWNIAMCYVTNNI